MPQVGLGEDDLSRVTAVAPRSPAAHRDVRFVSCGRLLHWKGFELGMRAFARADIPESRYWLIGDGPERGRLESLARELGVGPRVRFLGALPREQTLRQMGDCDVLLHPSLHESGGLVCLEAMAMGKPVVCLKLGGPAIQVTDGSGFAIPGEDPDQAVRDIARAMRRLSDDADLRLRMGETARQIARERFAWPAKAQTISAIYREVVRRNVPRATEHATPSLPAAPRVAETR
jgi:glycosyltransferase involved in cell wall biosynthesis